MLDAILSFIRWAFVAYLVLTLVQMLGEGRITGCGVGMPDCY
jgi:hypothetical protein